MPNSLKRVLRSLVHTAAGLFAGLLLGLLAEIFFFWPKDPDLGPIHFILRFTNGIRLPVIGPAVLGALCALGAAIAGGVELRGFPKHLVVGALIGVVLGGVVVGGFAYPAAAALFRGLDDPMFSKVIAVERLIGMSLGIPAGALLGLIIAMARELNRRRKHR